MKKQISNLARVFVLVMILIVSSIPQSALAETKSLSISDSYDSRQSGTAYLLKGMAYHNQHGFYAVTALNYSKSVINIDDYYAINVKKQRKVQLCPMMSMKITSTTLILQR